MIVLRLAEYAVGVEPSKQGDVYSYGILVLQLFTGRRPTDEMFVDDCNIQTFVKMSIPGRLMQIVDPALLSGLEVTIHAANPAIQNEVNYISGYNNDEIEADEENIDSENLSKMNSNVWKCILQTLEIGLACSEESPRNRMSMEEVLRELHRIQKCLQRTVFTSVERSQQKKRLNKRCFLYIIITATK